MIDPAYTDEVAELRQSCLFDATFYLSVNEDVRAAGVDPLLHFCRDGWREHRAPNPYFDVGFYLSRDRDLRASWANPLLHYHQTGEGAGLRPGPLFDPGWYALAAGLGADEPRLAHFLRHRLDDSASPLRELYVVPHLDGWRELRGQGVDPFSGFAAEHDPLPDPVDAEVLLVRASGLFDENFYLINAPDVLEAQIDPVSHFCRFGWREARDPSLYVDIAWYLRTNPVVAAMGVNPLLHYMIAGEAAGRRPSVCFDPVWYHGRYGPMTGLALADFMARRRQQRVSPNALFDVDWYMRNHGEAVGANRDPFAHYLYAARREDIDPSAEFDAGAYRRRHLGRRSRHFAHIEARRELPLLHRLAREYEGGD